MCRKIITNFVVQHTLSGRQIDISSKSADAKLPRNTFTGELLRNWVFLITATRINTFPSIPMTKVTAYTTKLGPKSVQSMETVSSTS